MNNYFDLRVEECGKLDLSNTIIKDIVDIDSADFKTNIKALDINGIRLLGRIYIDWKRNNVRDLILHQKTIPYQQSYSIFPSKLFEKRL